MKHVMKKLLPSVILHINYAILFLRYLAPN